MSLLSLQRLIFYIIDMTTNLCVNTNNPSVLFVCVVLIKVMELSEDEALPEAILEAAAAASLDLLPKISQQRYEKQYEHFLKWCKEKKVNSFREEVFLAYFADIGKVLKANTLWSRYSMIKSMVKIKQNVDISKFYKLTTFLKKQNVGFRPKKAKTFTKEDVAKFMIKAPDEVYLLIKVATIFGLAGACRRAELTNLTLDNVEDKGNVIIIRIADSKNHSSRSFVLSEEVNNGIFLKLYRKYTQMRSPKTPHRRFFVQYLKGKCTTQCVGVNTFGKMPADIAAYLRLPDPHLYTGHSFRRSSATFLADSGEDITNIKRLGGWKSTSVAEGYLEDSEQQKKKMCNKILSIGLTSVQEKLDVVPSPSPSTSTASTFPTNLNYPDLCPVGDGPSNSISTNHELRSAINLQSAVNCSFTINIINNK